MVNPLMHNLSPTTKALYFLMMTFFAGAALVFVGMLIIVGMSGSSIEAIESLLQDPNNPSFLPVLRILTTLNQIGSFLLAAWLFIRIFGMQSVEGLYLRRFAPLLWVMVPVMMVAASPLIDLTYRFNTLLIPEGSWLESVFKPMEDSGTEVTKAILHMPDIPTLLLNFLMIAVLPAIGEEIAFRGILQNQLAKSVRNIHLAVWISAILFSAYHLQFYGFIPRVLMGALFGYLVIWTGSIWPSIIAHLVNNSIAVFASWYAQQNPGFNEDEIFGSTELPELPWIIGSLVVFVVILYFIRRDSQWKEIRFAYTRWEKVPIVYDEPGEQD